MGELGAIDHFEAAVPEVPRRRIFVWFAVWVLFGAVAIANVAKALAEEPLTEASAALHGSMASMVSVDTNGLIDAAGKFDAASRTADRMIVIGLSLYLDTALPSPGPGSSRFARPTRRRGDASPTRRRSEHIFTTASIADERAGQLHSLGMPPAARDPVRPDRPGDAEMLPLLLGSRSGSANLENVASDPMDIRMVLRDPRRAGLRLFLVVPLGRPPRSSASGTVASMTPAAQPAHVWAREGLLPTRPPLGRIS